MYNMGINIGIFIGFLAGGWINQYLGWRAAFIAVGVPGLLFAIFVRLTLREPPRGMSEQRQAGDAPGRLAPVAGGPLHPSAHVWGGRDRPIEPPDRAVSAPSPSCLDATGKLAHPVIRRQSSR